MPKRAVVYLASPYGDGTDVRDRVNKVSMFAANLMSIGIMVYSPVTHGHYIQEAGSLENKLKPKSIKERVVLWVTHGKVMLERCDAMWILTLEGWECSNGIYEELLHAALKRIPMDIVSLDMNETELINKYYNIDELELRNFDMLKNKMLRAQSQTNEVLNSEDNKNE